MDCTSDPSIASTSGSDEESEIEQHEYEKRRELYLSKIIFCERKYQEIRPILLKLRLEQVEKLQDAILNRNSDIYLNRKSILDNEFEAKRSHIKTLSRLRQEALKRRLTGDRYNALVNLNNNKLVTKEKIRDLIKHKYQKLLTEEEEVEKLTGLTFGTSAIGNNEKTLVKVKAIEKYVQKRDKNGNTVWCNIPVLICQLPKHKIEEDLNKVLKVLKKLI